MTINIPFRHKKHEFALSYIWEDEWKELHKHPDYIGSDSITLENEVIIPMSFSSGLTTSIKYKILDILIDCGNSDYKYIWNIPEDYGTPMIITDDHDLALILRLSL